jgi:pre-mRNA-splicing helicase BRR2
VLFIDDRGILTSGRNDVATFVNSYPSLEVEHQFKKGDYNTSMPITLQVTLSIDAGEDDTSDGQTVVAPFYPVKKAADWWLVVGDVTHPNDRQLLVVKRLTVKREHTAKLEFPVSEGTRRLKLYVICDSYFGADHDIDLGTVEVAKMDSDGSDDSEEASDTAMEE